MSAEPAVSPWPKRDGHFSALRSPQDTFRHAASPEPPCNRATLLSLLTRRQRPNGSPGAYASAIRATHRRTLGRSPALSFPPNGPPYGPTFPAWAALVAHVAARLSPRPPMPSSTLRSTSLPPGPHRDGPRLQGRAPRRDSRPRSIPAHAAWLGDGLESSVPRPPVRCPGCQSTSWPLCKAPDPRTEGA